LPLGGLADQDIAFVSKGDNARGQPVALLVSNDFYLGAFHHRDYGIGGAQINADYSFSSHLFTFFQFNGRLPDLLLVTSAVCLV
jgi:hypothetical protein